MPITLPVAVHNERFKWQLDLFWYGHRRVYGPGAAARAHAILINRNEALARKVIRMEWDLDVPHSICESIHDLPASLPRLTCEIGLATPLNIQIGLAQVLPQFDDDQILEVIDCDMVHFRRCPIVDVEPNELVVSAVYENWHLFSLTSNRHVIARYFENNGEYYNGGFVPIVGRAATFRRILPEWIAVHIDILNRPYDLDTHWWAGMFALQAACEKARVQMVAKDYCYVPGANESTSGHYIGHYCVDRVFDKRTCPDVDVTRFPDNPFYRLVKDWIESKV